MQKGSANIAPGSATLAPGSANMAPGIANMVPVSTKIYTARGQNTDWTGDWSSLPHGDLPTINTHMYMGCD